MNNTTEAQHIDAADNNDSGEHELVERLMADTSGRVLEELRTNLAQGRKNAQNELNAGVGPDEFRALSDFVTATHAAEEVVEKFWAQNHVR